MIVEEFYNMLKRMKEDLPHAKQMSLFDYVRKEFNLQAHFMQALMQLEILARWHDKQDRRKLWYKYVAGEPTKVMALELYRTGIEIRRRQLEEAAQKRAEEKQKEKDLAEKAREARQSVSEDISNQLEVETPKKVKMVAKHPKKDSVDLENGIMKTTMVDAALKLMDIGLPVSILKRVLWAVDYVDAKGDEANMKEIIQFNSALLAEEEKSKA